MGCKKRDWKQVEEVVDKINELGLSYKDGAEQFGIEVGVLYEYNKRKKQGLQVDEQKPASSAASVPEAVKELVCDYRRDHPDHGFKRIQDELKTRHLVVVSRKSIRGVLKEAGLLGDLDSSFDRNKERGNRGLRRFEADYPGELYQMDVTYVYIQGLSALYLVMIIDDHSRFCVAAELCRDQRGDTLLSVLHNACLLHGTPKKLLTDQGSGFYTWSQRQTQFQDYLDERHIEHIVSAPHHPQTQGKVERLIQTVQKELLGKVRFNGYEDARAGIHSYVNSYNYDRPHQGIGGVIPADRFHGVIGERSRIESELVSRGIDFSKGYLIFKVGERFVSVVCSDKSLCVYLDGKLLKEAEDVKPD